MRIALIPCGLTDWRDQGRLLGRVELSMSDSGPQQCEAWASALSDLGLQRILHAPDELSTRTAAIVAQRLGVPTKPLASLVEVDLGLWAGLTEAELRTRYSSAHRRLCEVPLSVHPPGGESVQDAADRLYACLARQMRRNGSRAFGVVTRPLAFALACCRLAGREPGGVWGIARSAKEPVVVDCAAATRTKVSES